MNQQEIIPLSRDPEKEIANILIDSALYLEMSPADRQKLVHDLVSSYYNLLPKNNRRDSPSARRAGPTM